MTALFPDRAKYHVFEYACGHFSECGDAEHHPQPGIQDDPQPCGVCGGTYLRFRCPPGCDVKVSEPRYQDPTVAYNTGYNDGQREERDALLKALAAFEVSTLADDKLECSGLPRVMGRFKRYREELARGIHRAGK